jgi:hypothetical protein
MQTISTKLDKETAKKFLQICNDEGKCQSEMLRGLIENICDYDDESESTQKIESSEIRNPTVTIIDV